MRRVTTLFSVMLVSVLCFAAPTSAEPLWDDMCRTYRGGQLNIRVCWYKSQIAEWPYTDERMSEALKLLSDVYGVKPLTSATVLVNGYLAERFAGFYDPVYRMVHVHPPRDIEQMHGWSAFSLFVLIHEVGHVVLTDQGIPGWKQHCKMFNGPLWDGIWAQWQKWYPHANYPLAVQAQRETFCQSRNGENPI